VAFVVKNQENLIPKFPSQAARSSSITVKISSFCEDLVNGDDLLGQNKYNDFLNKRGIVELRRLTNLKSVFLDSPIPYTLITKNR